mmetsp:Transcript_28264/g.78014  ORF Transcript_28264/g.78014 Transcript_28264/m.78014 type:complete len:248 (-) Transcript_28264:636-1379(-)
MASRSMRWFNCACPTREMPVYSRPSMELYCTFEPSSCCLGNSTKRGCTGSSSTASTLVSGRDASLCVAPAPTTTDGDCSTPPWPPASTSPWKGAGSPPSGVPTGSPATSPSSSQSATSASSSPRLRRRRRSVDDEAASSSGPSVAASSCSTPPSFFKSSRCRRPISLPTTGLNVPLSHFGSDNTSSCLRACCISCFFWANFSNTSRAVSLSAVSIFEKSGLPFSLWAISAASASRITFEASNASGWK